MTLAAAGLLSCTGTGQSAFDPASVADASGEVTRVEPLSWWTGMQTPLQLLVNGHLLPRILAGGTAVQGSL